MGNRPQRRTGRGFSIVELMVSAVIGLIAVLAIFEVFTAFEGQKRTTTGGGDAQTNGTLALFMLKRDVRQAGYGFASLNVLNCNVRAYNDQRTPPEFTLTPMAPVVINPAGIPAGDANTDVIAITYGDTSGLGGGVSFHQQSGASANYQVTNRSGFQVGELVIATQPGLDCTVAQVTELPASGSCGMGGGVGQTDVVIHNAGNFSDPFQNCSNVPSHWNKPGGLGVTYTEGTLFSLGRLPKSFAYAVRGGNLTVCDLLASDCTDAAKTGDTTVWLPIANNIVGLHAQYGRDTGGPPMTGVVDTYDQTTPTDACGWARALVIRLAVVARSPQWEKAVVTTSPPSWSGGTFDLTGLTDWQHYRYRMFQTVSPLRNVIWMGAQGTC